MDFRLLPVAGTDSADIVVGIRLLPAVAGMDSVDTAVGFRLLPTVADMDSVDTAAVLPAVAGMDSVDTVVDFRLPRFVAHMESVAAFPGCTVLQKSARTTYRILNLLCFLFRNVYISYVSPPHQLLFDYALVLPFDHFS